MNAKDIVIYLCENKGLPSLYGEVTRSKSTSAFTQSVFNSSQTGLYRLESIIETIFKFMPT